MRSKPSKPIDIPQSLITLCGELESQGSPDYIDPPRLKKAKKKKRAKK